MTATRRVLLALMLGLLAIATGFGCSSTPEEENAAERPWNRPQGWEHGLPGMNVPR